MGKLETTVTLVTSKAGMAKLADAADLKAGADSFVNVSK